MRRFDLSALNPILSRIPHFDGKIGWRRELDSIAQLFGRWTRVRSRSLSYILSCKPANDPRRRGARLFLAIGASEGLYATMVGRARLSCTVLGENCGYREGCTASPSSSLGITVPAKSLPSLHLRHELFVHIWNEKTPPSFGSMGPLREVSWTYCTISSALLQLGDIGTHKTGSTYRGGNVIPSFLPFIAPQSCSE